MTLPTFLGIGVPRGGTTWLHTWLDSHPQVCMSTRRKEVRFFDRHYERGLGWYESFFCPPEERDRYSAVGEISPQYYLDPDCAKRIAAALPDVRLVVMMRHPVTRAYSNYGFCVQRANYRGSFERFLIDQPNALDKGFYGRHLRGYLRHFERDQILALVLEQSLADIGATQARVGAFLGVDAGGFAHDRSRDRVNASTVPAHGSLSRLTVRAGRRLRRWGLEPVVDAGRRLGVQRALSRGSPLPPLAGETKRRLTSTYEDDFGELESTLGLDLSCWRT